MSYARIAKAVTETPWAITRDKLDEIEAVLNFHIQGNKFSPEELRARFGEPDPPSAGKRGAVAVIPLQGVISHRMGGMTEMSGGMSTERFGKMFDDAMGDDSVSAIVADIDSPGGTITGVTELHAKIMAARGQKKLVAHVNALGASAAFWIASAFDEIWCTPSGSVGSIGIITAEHVDRSKQDEQQGIVRTTLSAGKYKGEGSGPLSDETKAWIKDRLETAYGVMTADIGAGRGIKASEVKAGYGEGRVLFAKDALKAGMIDKIGTFDELVGKLTGRRQVTGLRAKSELVDLQAEEPPAMTLAEPAASEPDAALATLRRKNRR